jgi:PKD repeat protein
MKSFAIICFVLLSSLGMKTYGQCEISPLTPLQGCAPYTVKLKAVNNYIGKTPVYYEWSWGDGNLSAGMTLNTVSHVFVHNGLYTVHLVMTFSDGSRCTTSLANHVKVYRLPDISGFTLLSASAQPFSKGGVKNKFCFKTPPDSQLHAPGTAGIARFIWNFGDGDTSHDASLCHTYDAVGQYIVSVQIFDSNGCSGYAVMQNRIFVYDLAYFRAELLNDGSHQFYNETDGNNLSFFWDFGNGHTSNDKNPNYYYPQDGTYNVCLSVHDTMTGERDTFCRTVTVPSECNVEFGRSYSADDIMKVSFHASMPKDSLTTIMWTFGKDTLYGREVEYTFPKTGKFPVCLFVKKGRCSMQKCVNIPVGYNLGGIVYGGYQLAEHAKIYLIKFDPSDSTLNLIDTTYLDTTSHYTFTELPAGKYLVKAALLPNDKLYSNYLPTYYDSALMWSDAISLDKGDMPFADIYLVRGNNPGGPGFIGGKVVQGANKKEGDPLEDIQITLLNDQEQPVTYAYSGADGSYSFDNMALGTYKIFAEVPGVIPVMGTITLTQNDPEVKEVEIKVQSQTTHSSIRKQGIRQPGSHLSFYPNPVSQSGTLILHSAKSREVTIEIYSVTGKRMISRNENIGSGANTIMIQTEGLGEGIYMLRAAAQDGEYQETISFSKVK